TNEVAKGFASANTASASVCCARRMVGVIWVTPTVVFVHRETAARERLRGRDTDNWPYLALALVFDYPGLLTACVLRRPQPCLPPLVARHSQLWAHSHPLSQRLQASRYHGYGQPCW